MTSLFLQQMSSMSLAVAAGMRMAPPQSAQNRSMELKLTWSFQRWEPQVQEMPIASSVVAFVITSPLPMWTGITDGSWSFLLGGVLLYALRGRRKVQLTVWALVIFLCDFALTFGMACRQDGFVWTQMFTDYYEWFEVAAVLLMLLYNGQRGKGHKQLFYWFYPAHVYLLYGASCLVYNMLR